MATDTRRKELGETSSAKERPQSDFDRLMEKNAEALERIDCISEEDLLLLQQGFSATMKMAWFIKELRSLLTDEILECIMWLQGSPLGFLTDKDKPPKGGAPKGWIPGYPVDVVRDVTIDATIRGFRMTGNEINIISGRLYAAKEGLSRKVREFKGLTDLRLAAGVPHGTVGGSLVEYHATWLIDGKKEGIHCVKTDTSDTRIPVKVNAAMGTDAILGKAERKMLARIYGRISGSEQYSQDTSSAQVAEQGSAAIPQATDESLTPPTSPLDALRVDMAEAESFTAIADVLARGKALSNSDFHELELCGELRRDEIRDARGERSNDESQQTAEGSTA